MAILEKPVGHFEYYKSMVAHYSKAYDDACEERDKLILESIALKNKLKENISVYKDKYDIDLSSYEEFENNIHTDAILLKVAKGAYLSKNNDYTVVADLWHLLRYAKVLEKIKILNDNINLYYKLSNLTLKEYSKILKTFYYKVHEKMILEGYGYVFDNNIGWTCINRVQVIKKNRKRKYIDFSATKEREKQLIAEGKRIYNKEEAEWCAANGIEYKAEDKRVFKDDEYFYEIPLINSKLPNSGDIELTIPNYRAKSTRNKTYDMLLKETNYNLHEICNLSIDLRAKLSLCLRANNILYTNFIRNEDQKSINVRKTNC